MPRSTTPSTSASRRGCAVDLVPVPVLTASIVGGVTRAVGMRWRRYGWAFLTIATNPSMSNLQQAVAAGYVEATLSQHRIYQCVTNTPRHHLAGKGSPSRVPCCCTGSQRWCWYTGMG